MAHNPDERNKDRKQDQPTSKPDPETLHTTDPQDHMKGPVSSTMQGIKEEAEKNDDVSRDEANKERDENM